MKVSKFLVVTLAALLPALESAGDTYYVYDVLSSAPDGNPLKTNKVRLPAEEGATYAITALDGCCKRCTLNDMKNCTERLEKFQLNANCGLEKKGILDQNATQKQCAKGEKLVASLRDPRTEPATVMVELKIDFSEELEKLDKQGLEKIYSPDIVRDILEQKLRRLKERRDAARLAAAKSTAARERATAERKRATAERERAEREYERAVAEREQATAELQQASAAFNASQRAYNASKRELIQSVGEICAELISALE